VKIVTSTSVPTLVEKLLKMSPMAAPEKLVKDAVAKDHKHPISEMLADVGDLKGIRQWRG
jgi:hypothetical protein